ncbi:hypothetical protein [Thaumasiovibrio sp. DFM-14]|uniref:hypothetical protein n=1 Tax=Thaumasiovibrio sp. DFM-14 TaxID=3384792 RepID=UPI0039A1541B
MKISIEIEGTENEICRALEIIAANHDISHLVSTNIEASNLGTQQILEVFERLSWESFYLLHFLHAQGELKEAWHEGQDWYVCSLEQLETHLSLTERNIRARINGVKNSCTSRDITPFVYTHQGTSERLYCLNKSVEPVLLDRLNKWKATYDEWLTKSDLPPLNNH